jgi:ABC-type amino acid transport substrate-binding protein
MTIAGAEPASDARRSKRRRGHLGLAVLLGALAFLTPGLAGCGGERTEASGNAGTGRFDAPPIQSHVPAAVREACDVSSPTLDRIRKDGVLFWAIGLSPQFGFQLESGEWAGVEAQNAAELATVLGVDFHITAYQYDVLPETLATGQADIVGAQLFVTEDRRKVIDFSLPYYESGQLFYVLADSAYRAIDDLNKPDVRFVYPIGGGQLELAKKYVPRARIEDFALRGHLLLYEWLVDGRADVTMTEAAPLKVILDRYRDPPLAAIGLDGRVSGERASSNEILDPFDVAFGLPKGDTGWRRCVNAWVRDLLDSGRMTERLEYWLAQTVG